MEIVISFAIGFLLAALGVNILSNIAEILQIFTDWIKAAVSVHIAKCGAKIQEYSGTQDEAQQSCVHAIGFEIPQDYEYDEDEEYDK